MQKIKAIALFITCIVTPGCTLHLFKWSTQEVAWFSCVGLLLTGGLLYSANRITVQRDGSPYAGIGPVLCLPGLFFLVWGSKLDLINAFGSGVPFWDQWSLEGRVFPAVLEGKLDPLLLFRPHGEHNHFLSHLLTVTLLKLNGQWDPIVEMVVDSLIYSLVLTGLCLVLWRLAGRKDLPLFCIMIAVSGVLHFGWENTLSGFQSCFYFLLGFSLLSMVMLVCSKPFTIAWFLGLVAALLGQLSLGTGFFAPFAVACVLLVNCISGTRKLKEAAPAIVTLVMAAILVFELVPSHHASFESIGPTGFIAVCAGIIGFLKNFAKAAAWPFPGWAFAVVLWFPFFILVRKQFHSKKTSTLAQFLLSSGIWALLHAAAIAWSRGSLAPRYKDIMIVGVWVNLIVTFYLLRARGLLSNHFSRYRSAIAPGAAILALCTGVSVLHLNTSDIWTQNYSGFQEVNTARYILTGDPSSLRDKPRFHIPVPPEQADGLMAVLNNRTLRKVLPTCIRAPLPLEPAESLGFRAGAIAPGLPPLTHRSVLGSWKADKGLSKSEYLSRPVSSSFQWLVFDISGGGPGASLELLPSEGRAVAIDIGRGSGWRKTMVKTPRGPFRLHAFCEGGDGWIAFSLPRELAGGGYCIRRILSENLFVILFGMLGLLAGLIIESKENLPLHQSANPIFPEIL